MRSSQTCHKLLKATAEEFAGAFYEDEASLNNVFYKRNPNQKLFVRKHWGKFVVAARETLAKMLGASSVPEEQKEIIFEALQLDRVLPGGGEIRPH